MAENGRFPSATRSTVKLVLKICYFKNYSFEDFFKENTKISENVEKRFFGG